MTEIATYAEALRRELVYLWCDLARAYRDSRPTPPEASTGFEGLTERIVAITRLVGPVSPEQVELPFLATGMYEHVHAQAGLTLTVPADLLEEARAHVARNTPPPPTDAELHARMAHPDYEYEITQGQRKAWDHGDVPPDGDGWERNTDAGRPGQGWDRFDYHEESYWRRLRPSRRQPSSGHPLA